jgi:hypothetical protein
MKKSLLILAYFFLSLSSYSQIDTASTRRTTVSGFAPKIITDAHLRAASSLSIPYVNSTTPSMNGAINRAGYGLQLLSNSRLAIGIGSSSFSQYMDLVELNATYQKIANISTDLTASATRYPTVNAVNTGLALKANLASPSGTGTATWPTITATTALNGGSVRIETGGAFGTDNLARIIYANSTGGIYPFTAPIGHIVIQPRGSNNSDIVFATGATAEIRGYFKGATGNLHVGYTDGADLTYKLSVNGITNAAQYKLSALNTAPASATATGTLGEIRVTATHIYICTATNAWVRAALATW